MVHFMGCVAKCSESCQVFVFASVVHETEGVKSAKKSVQTHTLCLELES